MHFVQTKGILSARNGMNLYRGCMHGCIYCDSRSACYQMHHPFEDIEVKENAIELLDHTLRSKRKKGMIATGSMSDPYMPIEQTLHMTHQSMECALKHGFGYTVLTKSDHILDDLDVLRQLHQKTRCVVQMTLTCMDDELSRIIEPGVCPTSRRIEVLKILQKERIPTVVWLCPVLPYLTDTKENITGIVNACHKAGVWGIICFGMGVTLREGNREYFYDCLDRHFPGLKQKYIRTYGQSYTCSSIHHNRLMHLFHDLCRKYNIEDDPGRIFDYLQYFEEKKMVEQLTLF